MTALNLRIPDSHGFRASDAAFNRHGVRDIPGRPNNNGIANRNRLPDGGHAALNFDIIGDIAARRDDIADQRGTAFRQHRGIADNRDVIHAFCGDNVSGLFADMHAIKIFRNVGVFILRIAIVRARRGFRPIGDSGFFMRIVVLLPKFFMAFEKRFFNAGGLYEARIAFLCGVFRIFCRACCGKAGRCRSNYGCHCQHSTHIHALQNKRKETKFLSETSFLPVRPLVVLFRHHRADADSGFIFRRDFAVHSVCRFN